VDPKFRSSFIPKKPLPVKSSGKVKQHHSFNLVIFLAAILFIAAIGLTGAAFFYENVMETRVNEKGNELNSKKNSLDLGSVEAYRALGKRLEAAQTLMNTHKAVSKLFHTLNEKTLHNISYTGIDIKDTLNGLNPAVEIEGLASSFNALTVQTDVFRRENIIKDMEFSEISLDGSGNVLFVIRGKLTGNELLYTN